MPSKSYQTCDELAQLQYSSSYKPLWIWLMPCVSRPINVNNEMTIGEAAFIEAMQVEWSKCWACMQRWEELLIVQEEMQPAIVYHMWKAVCEHFFAKSH
jgi:hypothetical protein